MSIVLASLGIVGMAASSTRLFWLVVLPADADAMGKAFGCVAAFAVSIALIIGGLA